MLDAGGLRVLLRAGLLTPARPDRLAGMGLALARWRVSPAAAYAAGASRHPYRVALVDDDGPLTFREVDRRTDVMAAELRRRGVASGDAVGLLARNGRGFVETAVALAKCGADVLYLSTGSAPGPLAQVLEREQVAFCVRDEDLADLVPQGVGTAELGAVARRTGRPPVLARRTSRQVILTSGTTGAPKGAARAGGSLGDLVAALSALPLRGRETTVIAAPVFHAWGLGQLSLGMLLGSTCVLSRSFDPEQVLTSIQAHRASALVVVPVMLEKLLEADPSRFDTSSLRLIASSGSALPGDLVARTTAAFGPVLHNLYGSTEVAYAAVATPADLARDPRVAGRAPYGVTLRVLDAAGRPVPAGVTGSVFVGSTLAFDGYTDGSDKPRVGHLVATGDLGVLSADGLLTVLGRDDDMVVVGGENVFTGQVENTLLEHDAVLDAAVVDEPDPVYGVRLVAHVVLARPVAPEELQLWVRDRLARHAAPREVRVHDELARSVTGKLVKRDLRSCA